MNSVYRQAEQVALLLITLNLCRQNHRETAYHILRQAKHQRCFLLMKIRTKKTKKIDPNLRPLETLQNTCRLHPRHE